MIKRTITQSITKDKPEGEILKEDYRNEVRFLGIKISSRIVNYDCTLELETKKPGF